MNRRSRRDPEAIAVARDQRRDRFLTEQGYQVLRILGYDVLRNPTVVRRIIEQAVDERAS